MPNWVTNILTFNLANSTTKPDVLEAFLKGKNADGSERVFDFNKIIPMPESLNIEAGSRGETGYREYTKFLQECEGKSARLKESLERQYIQKLDKETWELGKAYYTNKQNYGCTNWYDWCCDNWGTKWNACDVYIIDMYDVNYFKVAFDTAWSAPVPVVVALSKRFPDIGITHEWADENIGYNTGEIEYWDGETETYDVPSEGSKEAFEMSFSVLGIDADEVGLVYDENTGTYECKD